MLLDNLFSKLPRVTEDPFLKYRPFPENPSNGLEKHWHEIAVSFVFYFAVQLLSGPIFSIIMGTGYTKLPKGTRVNFDVHVTSMVQCFVSIVLLLLHLNNPHFANRDADPANSLLGLTDFGAMTCSVTVGYFIWDIYVCARYFSLFGVGFLFHALAALYAFFSGLFPYGQPWAGAFLAFELSTPFVNLNWFASKLPAGTFSEKFLVINGLLLIAVFFFARIFWGFYAVFQFAVDISYTFNEVNKLMPLSLLGLNFLLDCLNVFWFYKMVMIAKKKVTGSKSTRQAAQDVGKKIE
ncbi:Topoisomerase I damage affected protein 4 [Candida viswanathii]|uniref:Topoisomerase I damage affected protein 4 n=1 Tax=Candida viswanathii TaxID=5486 RepID=A0A367XRE4_9ASCO|nr:Topoisomerase I damage affected protein 4 [Candida viswanathii]